MPQSQATAISTNMTFPSLKKPTHILATWFGIGLLKPAPGTWGSLAAVVTWYFLEPLLSWSWLTVSLFVLFILVSWYACAAASQDSNSNDHSAIVIDEVAGMLVALLFVPHTLMMYGSAFVLFRFFDILKPWPISWVDQNIKGGWGVLFDDLIAGLFTGVIILLLSSMI